MISTLVAGTNLNLASGPTSAVISNATVHALHHVSADYISFDGNTVSSAVEHGNVVLQSGAAGTNLVVFRHGKFDSSFEGRNVSWTFGNLSLEGGNSFAASENSELQILTEGEGKMLLEPIGGPQRFAVDNLLFEGNDLINEAYNGNINLMPNSEGYKVDLGSIKIGDDLLVTGDKVYSLGLNQNINIQPNGNGTVIVNSKLVAGKLLVDGSKITNKFSNENVRLLAHGNGQVKLGNMQTTKIKFETSLDNYDRPQNVIQGIDTTLDLIMNGNLVIDDMLNNQSAGLHLHDVLIDSSNGISTLNVPSSPGGYTMQNVNLRLSPSGSGLVTFEGDDSAISGMKVDHLSVTAHSIASISANRDITVTPDGDGKVMVKHVDNSSLGMKVNVMASVDHIHLDDWALVVYTPDTDLLVTHHGIGKTITDSLILDGLQLDVDRISTGAGDLALTAAGNGQLSSSNIMTDQLSVAGNTISSLASDLVISANGTHNIVSNTMQVDNILSASHGITVNNLNDNLKLNTDHTATVHFGPSLNNAKLSIDDSHISTASNIRIQPIGSGHVFVGQKLKVENVQLDGNIISVLDIEGNFSMVPHGAGHVIFNSPLNANSLTIAGDEISSTDNVVLCPNAAGAVRVTDKNVIVDNFQIHGNSSSTAQANVILTPASNRALVQSIDAANSDDLVLNASKTVAFNSLTLDHMKVTGSSVTTKDTNVNLYLRSHGDGTIVFNSPFRADGVLLNSTSLTTTSIHTDLTIDPDGQGKSVLTNLALDHMFLEKNTFNAVDGKDLNVAANGAGVVNATNAVAVEKLQVKSNSLISTELNSNIKLTPTGSGKVTVYNVSSVVNSDVEVTTSDRKNFNIVVPGVLEHQLLNFDGANVLSTVESSLNTNLKLTAGTGKVVVKMIGNMSPTSQNLALDVRAGNKVLSGQTLNIDNIRLKDNTLSTTDHNENLILQPNGAGKINILNSAKLTSGLMIDGNSISLVSNDENCIFAPRTKLVTSKAVVFKNSTSVHGSLKTGNLLADRTSLYATDIDGNMQLAPAASSSVVAKTMHSSDVITLQPSLGQNVAFDMGIHVDNLDLYGDTLGSAYLNGNVNIFPAGSGSIVAENKISIDSLVLKDNRLTGISDMISLVPDGDGSVVLNNTAVIDNIFLDSHSVATTFGDLHFVADAGKQVATDLLRAGTFQAGTSNVNFFSGGIGTPQDTSLALTSVGFGRISTGAASTNELTPSNLTLTTSVIGTTSGTLNLTPNGINVIQLPSLSAGSILSNGVAIHDTSVTADDGSDLTFNASDIVGFSDIASSLEFHASNVVFTGNTLATPNNLDIILTPHGSGSVVASTTGTIDVAEYTIKDESVNVTTMDGDVDVAAIKLVVDQHATVIDNITLQGNSISTNNADCALHIGHNNYDAIFDSKVTFKNVVLTGSADTKLSIENNTVSTFETNEDIDLSGQAVGDKAFLDGLDITDHVRAPTGDLGIAAGNIVLPTGSTNKIALSGFHLEDAQISTASSDIYLESDPSSHILFDASGTGAIAIGTDFTGEPSASIDVVGSITAKHYLVDVQSTVGSSPRNYSPLSSLSASSFSDIGLSKTFVLHAQTVVMVHYSLSTTFRTSSSVDTVGVQVSALFLATGGSESEMTAGRSAQGYQATGTDSADVTQTSNLATNTGMVMKSLAAGTHRFSVKTKHVMCGSDCSAGYTDNLPNDPTSSAFYDARSIQVIVLGSQN